jgi:UDP-N-acetylglucosamine acyltransferase
MAHGNRAAPTGLNVVGLRRSGCSNEDLKAVKTMYRLLYNEGLTVDDAVQRMEGELPESVFRTTFVSFLRKSERGVCR